VRYVNVLDLDAIFDPDRRTPALRSEAHPATCPPHQPGPEDLPPDWRVEWEERAAVLEYDGGQPRERAEALALTEISLRMQAVDAGYTCDEPK
jgi:hypothetical protein